MQGPGFSLGFPLALPMLPSAEPSIPLHAQLYKLGATTSVLCTRKSILRAGKGRRTGIHTSQVTNSALKAHLLPVCDCS